MILRPPTSAPEKTESFHPLVIFLGVLLALGILVGILNLIAENPSNAFLLFCVCLGLFLWYVLFHFVRKYW